MLTAESSREQGPRRARDHGPHVPATGWGQQARVDPRAGAMGEYSSKQA